MATADRQAEMAALVRAHQAGIWRYLRFLGCDPTEADDLVQETFLVVLRKGVKTLLRRARSALRDCVQRRFGR